MCDGTIPRMSTSATKATTTPSMPRDKQGTRLYGSETVAFMANGILTLGSVKKVMKTVVVVKTKSGEEFRVAPSKLVATYAGGL